MFPREAEEAKKKKKKKRNGGWRKENPRNVIVLRFVYEDWIQFYIYVYERLNTSQVQFVLSCIVGGEFIHVVTRIRDLVILVVGECNVLLSLLFLVWFIFITRRFEKKEIILIFILTEGFEDLEYAYIYKVCARMENLKFNRFNLGWFWNERERS